MNLTGILEGRSSGTCAPFTHDDSLPYYASDEKKRHVFIKNKLKQYSRRNLSTSRSMRSSDGKRSDILSEVTTPTSRPSTAPNRSNMVDHQNEIEGIEREENEEGSYDKMRKNVFLQSFQKPRLDRREQSAYRQWLGHRAQETQERLEELEFRDAITMWSFNRARVEEEIQRRQESFRYGSRTHNRAHKVVRHEDLSRERQKRLKKLKVMELKQRTVDHFLDTSSESETEEEKKGVARNNSGVPILVRRQSLSSVLTSSITSPLSQSAPTPKYESNQNVDEVFQEKHEREEIDPILQVTEEYKNRHREAVILSPYHAFSQEPQASGYRINTDQSIPIQSLHATSTVQYKAETGQMVNGSIPSIRTRTVPTVFELTNVDYSNTIHSKNEQDTEEAEKNRVVAPLHFSAKNQIVNAFKAAYTHRSSNCSKGSISPSPEGRVVIVHSVFDELEKLQKKRNLVNHESPQLGGLVFPKKQTIPGRSSSRVSNTSLASGVKPMTSTETRPHSSSSTRSERKRGGQIGEEIILQEESAQSKNERENLSNLFAPSVYRSMQLDQIEQIKLSLARKGLNVPVSIIQRSILVPEDSPLQDCVMALPKPIQDTLEEVKERKTKKKSKQTSARNGQTGNNNNKKKKKKKKKS